MSDLKGGSGVQGAAIERQGHVALPPPLVLLVPVYWGSTWGCGAGCWLDFVCLVYPACVLAVCAQLGLGTQPPVNTPALRCSCRMCIKAAAPQRGWGVDGWLSAQPERCTRS